ncbi:MAG TPA: putative glycolipid-binding domain-containing protein [Actinocrinis sp.]|nr:putative glycolipid-binding domain-containing protein [Actinocrinis sp.]
MGVQQRRHLVWQVVETAGFEAAWLGIDGLALHANGRAVGQLPEPYWLTYTLRTDDRAVTTRLSVTAATADAHYDLDLRREGETWYVNGEPRADLAGALDCDLACSPVTNTMPIIRHGLQRGTGTQRFLMAFVQVPTLSVVASQQSYTHLSLNEDAARVRYASGTFVSDLTVDRDGLVIDYPTMASRIPAVTPVTAGERVGGPGSPRPGADGS